MILLQDDTIWTLSHFLFGLTYAITASFIFIFVLLVFFKPKIKIAPFLIKVTSEEKPYYIFKIVNSSIFSAHELKIELFKIMRIPMGGGEVNNAHYKLSISNGEVSRLPPRPFWRKSQTNPHCLIVRSFDDINAILRIELNGLLLRISLKHGLTGLSSVYEQEFAHETDIKTGKFKPGKKFALK